jgi:DNA-binding NarL/FixJ family response regulator
MTSRVHVADGLAVVRTGVRALLERDGYAVTESGTIDELVASLETDPPELALVELHLPPAGGVAAVAEVTRRSHARVVMWSLSPSHDDVVAAIRAGAAGYLHKEVSPAGLLRALRGAAHGEAPISRDLASIMIEGFQGLHRRVLARRLAETLSAREREVLHALSGGSRNREIAAALLISEFTVKRHVQNILAKLGLDSRRAAAVFYRTAFATDERMSA